MEEGLRFQVLAPVVKGRKGTYDTLLADFAGQGFVRAIVDGQLIDLNEEYELELERYETHDISVVVDRLSCAKGSSAGSPTRSRRRSTSRVASPNSKSSRRRVIPRRSSSANTCRARATASRSMSCAEEFLLQLAVRRLLTLRWSRHRVRGRCSARDPRPGADHCGWAIQPWAGGRSRYFSRLVESICELYEIPRICRGRTLEEATDLLLHGRGVKGRGRSATRIAMAARARIRRGTRV